MLAECGKGNAKVDVLTNPRAQGYTHAKELLRGALLERYRHKDLLLFLVDADGKDRKGEFQSLEEEAAFRGVRLGDSRRAGGGRDLLMKETLGNYGALLQLCPELAELERRLRGL